MTEDEIDALLAKAKVRVEWDGADVVAYVEAPGATPGETLQGPLLLFQCCEDEGFYDEARLHLAMAIRNALESEKEEP
jgi:hypothetical protein